MSREKRELNYPRIIGWSLGALIILAIVLIIIKIKIWDKGIALDPTIDDNPDFDYETVDNITLFPVADMRENDDGELTILFFGNDTYALDESGHNLITDTYGKEMGATIYNFCLPGSSMAPMSENVADDFNPLDPFSLYGLVQSKVNNDFSVQRMRLADVPEERRDYYAKVIDEIEKLDFDKVDIFMYCYDGHDFQDQRMGISLFVDDASPLTLYGSVYSTSEMICDNYPESQIVYVAPTYCEILLDGKYVGADVADYGLGNMPTLINPIMSISMSNIKVSYLDMYFGSGINADTAKEYFGEDRIVPNDKGKEKIAQRMLRMTKFITLTGEDE